MRNSTIPVTLLHASGIKAAARSRRKESVHLKINGLRRLAERGVCCFHQRQLPRSSTVIEIAKRRIGIRNFRQQPEAFFYKITSAQLHVFAQRRKMHNMSRLRKNGTCASVEICKKCRSPFTPRTKAARAWLGLSYAGKLL